MERSSDVVQGNVTVRLVLDHDKNLVALAVNHICIEQDVNTEANNRVNVDVRPNALSSGKEATTMTSGSGVSTGAGMKQQIAIQHTTIGLKLPNSNTT